MIKRITTLLAIGIVSIAATVSANTLADYIATYNPSEAQYIADVIEDKAAKYNIDPLFAAAVFELESNYHNTAISDAGAIGIAQLMPATASDLQVNPHSIEQNIDGGVRYLRQMIDLYSNKGRYKYNYALAAYNAGMGNVGNSIPTYTYDYINQVGHNYNNLKKFVTVFHLNKNHNKIINKSKLNQLKTLYELKRLYMLKNQYKQNVKERK